MRYALKDVTRDRAALAEFTALGGRLPPLTVIDGVAVQGFDLPRLEALLDEEEGDHHRGTEGTTKMRNA